MPSKRVSLQVVEVQRIVPTVCVHSVSVEAVHVNGPLFIQPPASGTNSMLQTVAPEGLTSGTCL